MADYSVDTNLEVRTNSKSFMRPGIVEGVKLVDVTYGTTPKGNEFVSFHFEDSKGDIMSHSEFPVTLRKPMDAMSDDEKKDYLTSIDTQKRRIGQIVTTFVSKDKYSFVANSFKEFAENIIRILNDRDKNVTARIKVVYNKKNFTTLPSYWKYPFIEPMTVSKEDSKIRVLNIDKFSKSTADIESDPVDIPHIPEVSTKGEDDLPF